MKPELRELKGSRLALYVGGEFVASVTPEMWYSMPESSLDELDESDVIKIRSEINARKAYSSALRLITLRSHSEKELREKLRRKYDADAAEAAVERCRGAGFLNDEVFAADLAQELATKKRWGVMRIRQELYAKGIGRDLIDAAVDSLDVDFGENIRYIIENKYYDCLDTPQGKRKLYAALIRLGYSAEEVREALSFEY